MRNLCEMIVNKTVKNYKKILDEKMALVRQEKNLIIDEQLNVLNYRSFRAEFRNYIKEKKSYETAEKELINILKNMYKDAWQYYFALMKRYNVTPLVEESLPRARLKKEFSWPRSKTILEKLVTSYEDEKWELKIFYDKQIEDLFQRLGTFAEEMFGKIVEG